jgi:hypothetical protein
MLTNFFISINALLLHLIQIAVISFLLLAVTVSFTTIFLSWQRQRSECRKRMLHQKYENIIFSFLHHGDMSQVSTIRKELGKIEKWTFAGILNDLSIYFKYKDQEKIRQIAAVYDLESYMLKNIRRAHSVYRIRALKILVNIGCTQKSYPTLQKLEKSKNDFVRLYSIQNLILYGSYDIEKEFPKYKYPLSLWEQMIYFSLFKYRLKEIPDFSTFLYSPNITIILFGLRMMRLFHQPLEMNSTLEKILIKNKDTQVPMELYRLLATNNKDLYKGFFSNTDLYNIEDMLSNYARLDYMTTDTMLDIYYHTNDSVIKKHILICIYDYVSGGKSDIEYFATYNDDMDLNEMCKKIITERNGK